MLLDGQCIVSHESFQHVVLNWLPLILTPCPHIQVEKAEERFSESSVNSEAAVLRYNIKIAAPKIFGKFSGKHPWWGPVLINCSFNCNFIRIVLHCIVFVGIF